MSLNRNGREFVGLWRGGREFTELRRGERVLWQKEGPEVPAERLERLTVTAASYADLALLDLVLWVIGQGHAGHVLANIGGEKHVLAGDRPLLTVLSEVTGNDGCRATLSLGSESELVVGSLREGDTITLELVVEAKGITWLPMEVDENELLLQFPCLLPDKSSAVLYGMPSSWDGEWRYPEIVFNGIYLGTVLSGWYEFDYIPELSPFVGVVVNLSTQHVERVLSETTARPLTMVLRKLPTAPYRADGCGFKLAWQAINRTITLIVTKDAD
ncbi:MAG: hypothetical protein IKZ07_05930 [Akkermansia sp.]|nr:hypothetical protein [Akkermansia sp.]